MMIRKKEELELFKKEFKEMLGEQRRQSERLGALGNLVGNTGAFGAIVTNEVNKQSDPEPTKNQTLSQIEIFIIPNGFRKNAAGVSYYEVGHTAIRIGDKVYGYYPTDLNNDGRYSKDDLGNSPGDLQIESFNDFLKHYAGYKMTVYNLNISNEQTQLLYLALERIASAPGYYSLQGNHCTTIAFQCLESAGFKFKRDYNMFLNEAIGGEEQYQGLNLTPSRFIYHLDKKRKEDPSQFNDVFYITVPKKK